MFGITVNSRESYDAASLQMAATAAEARAKFVAEWGTLYDTDVVALYKIEDDLSTTLLLAGDTDAQDGSDVDPDEAPEEDEGGEPVPLPILADYLNTLDEILAPYSA